MSHYIVKASVWYFAGVAWDERQGRLKIISTQRQASAARLRRSAACRLAQALRRNPEIRARVIRLLPAFASIPKEAAAS